MPSWCCGIGPYCSLAQFTETQHLYSGINSRVASVRDNASGEELLLKAYARSGLADPLSR
jgi:hypothetical protein